LLPYGKGEKKRKGGEGIECPFEKFYRSVRDKITCALLPLLLQGLKRNLNVAQRKALCAFPYAHYRENFVAICASPKHLTQKLMDGKFNFGVGPTVVISMTTTVCCTGWIINQSINILIACRGYGLY